MSGPFGSSQWMYNSGSGYEIEQSLRFNTGDSPSLSRTPASASNRRTYTLSAWVKRTGLSHSSKHWDEPFHNPRFQAIDHLLQ